ncbi:MAG TPA: L-lactate dehydrogenase [Vitreimonas sp.]|uniref:L-lactate dehydrogenase n=1 Tax=Vitreimonas sp. TaxID=3069702 RepID=UPI002D707D95|nr:L-lactate dehydrogenase [Vitreimonas sp.]HYD88438.1 L-lactate dehydrogenase [Vitreimonas sp.]
MNVASISDFRELARRRLPRMFFDYIDGGSYDEITLRRNVSDMQSVALRQRVMRDVSKLSLATELFGRGYSMPVGLGPVGFAGMFARRGETQAARAAARAGVPFCLSTLGICGVDEVAAASSAPIWFQLYMIKDRGVMSELLARAARLECAALVFTLDLPVAGARYRDYRAGMSAPPGVAASVRRAWQGLTHPAWLWDVYVGGGPHAFGNLAGAVKDAKGFGRLAAWVAANFDATLTWADLGWVRERWKGPIIVKGILDAEDAREAVASGVDGLVVSNHGGRQLDGASSSIAALPRVADIVAGRATVLMDGGVRSGLDVLRALASGAQACLLGRAWAYALAAQGEAGVARALEIIRAELAVAMALTGCTDVRAASRDLLV